jgi:glutamate synthase domain-containing protein 1
MKTDRYGRTGSQRGVKAPATKPSRADWSTPAPQGLFDPKDEKDSCGVGFIADIKGRKSHQIVEDALTILLNLEHRGAVGADPRAGDGAGILVQIPHKFFAKKTKQLGFERRRRSSSASSFPRPANTRSATCSCRVSRSGVR